MPQSSKADVGQVIQASSNAAVHLEAETRERPGHFEPHAVTHLQRPRLGEPLHAASSAPVLGLLHLPPKDNRSAETSRRAGDSELDFVSLWNCCELLPHWTFSRIPQLQGLEGLRQGCGALQQRIILLQHEQRSRGREHFLTTDRLEVEATLAPSADTGEIRRCAELRHDPCSTRHDSDRTCRCSVSCSFADHLQGAITNCKGVQALYHQQPPGNFGNLHLTSDSRASVDQRDESPKPLLPGSVLAHPVSCWRLHRNNFGRRSELPSSCHCGHTYTTKADGPVYPPTPGLLREG
mmetsp:Transcript_128158/g.239851  ORF Transcript_128158/g.239851 Transcript_128158/m.239851 type:complete len:294 (-) Transcript_128158:319-1200(-)